MTLLVILGYIAIAVIATRSFAWLLFKASKAEWPSLYSDQTVPGGEDIFFGMLIAFFWPLTIPMWFFYRLVRLIVLGRKPTNSPR